VTWLAPWAFAGLVAVAGPLLAHWLARQQADRLRFPTLQFLVHTPPVSVRRHRVRDVPLLLVRSLIVVSAVAALAQPVWRGPAAPAAQPARAIVLDTSASLQRPRADGRAGADVAREAADVLAAEARGQGAPVLVDPAADVAAGVARAAAWLARQPAPRELVVVSDFQAGALVATDLDVVPPDAGVRLVPVPVSGPVPAAPAPARRGLRVLAGAVDAREAAAAEAAARALVPEETSSEKTPDVFPEILLVFPGAPDFATMKASSQPVRTPELFVLVSDIERERRRLGVDLEKPPGVSFAQKTSGVTSEGGLAVFADIDPGGVEAAVLMAAILRAAESAGLPLAEREPDALASDLRERWEREATLPDATPASAGTSDGRWLWALALALFVVEWRMRA
jgi:hypothetical protein